MVSAYRYPYRLRSFSWLGLNCSELSCQCLENIKSPFYPCNMRNMSYTPLKHGKVTNTLLLIFYNPQIASLFLFIQVWNSKTEIYWTFYEVMSNGVV